MLIQLVAKLISIVYMTKRVSIPTVWIHVLLRVVVMEPSVLYKLTKHIVFVQRVHKGRQWYHVYRWCANIMKIAQIMKHVID